MVRFATPLAALLLSVSLAQTPEPAPVQAPPARADLSAVNALLREKDYAGAEDLLYELEEAHPDDPAVLFKLGEVLLVLDETEDARDYLQRAAELDPERERVHFQLAIALAGSGKVREAVEAFGKEIALTEEPQIVKMARMNRAMMYRQLLDWKASAEELRAYVELSPEEPAVYGDLANALMESGDPAGAEAALEAGLAKGLDAAGHYYALGARHYKDGRYADAERCLARSLAIDPANPGATRSLAATLEQLGRADEAQAQLRRYLELAPDAPDRGKVLEQLGEAG